jgi:proline iminopeptidase
LAFARIESHYFVNAGFLQSDGALHRNAGRLAGIPGTIVHGRYDAVTPVSAAINLHNAWPDSQLRIVPDGGHAMTEPGIVDELVRATHRYADPAV